MCGEQLGSCDVGYEPARLNLSFWVRFKPVLGASVLSLGQDYRGHVVLKADLEKEPR